MGYTDGDKLAEFQELLVLLQALQKASDAVVMETTPSMQREMWGVQRSLKRKLYAKLEELLVWAKEDVEFFDMIDTLADWKVCRTKPTF